MGFMDSLKKASGLGLNADEHYQRAYEKGVLLGADHYSKAAELFDVAAKKAAESGDAQLQIRARANAAFYGFVTTGSRDHLVVLRDALQNLPEIEEIGSQREMLQSEPLINEIEARLAEDATASSTGDPGVISKRHADAANAFRKLLGISLVTYRYHSPDHHRETGDQRYFLHMGMASRYDAMNHAMDDPETAAEKMAKALSAFRQCGDEGLATDASNWVENLRMKRTCWLCHRDFQGRKLHFDVFPARVTGHAQATVARLNEDEKTIDRENSTVVLCTLCSSGIRNLADEVAERRVDALRDEVETRLSSHEETMSVMIDRIKQLERMAHTH